MKKTTAKLTICLFLIFSLNSYAKPTHYDQTSPTTPETTIKELNVQDLSNDDYEGGDLFPGTIEYKGNRYILSRCTSGGDDYVLDFIQQKDKVAVDQLIKTKSIFWINVFGVYNSINDEHHLKVKDVSEVHVGQSCHLTDALESLFK